MVLCKSFYIIFPLIVIIFFCLPAKAEESVGVQIESPEESSTKFFMKKSGEKSRNTGLDVAVFSGISFLNNVGSSYSSKILPVIGISFFPYYAPGPAWRLENELSFHHTFRSNYSGYYYYSSHTSFSIINGIRLYISPGWKVSASLLAGAGVTHTFSNYINESYFVVCSGFGIKFKDSFINDLFINYYHSFLLDFYRYETIRIYITASIWDGSRELRGSRERDK